MLRRLRPNTFLVPPTCCLQLNTSVTFGHAYMHALSTHGHALACHFPSLRSLTLRQDSAARKPLPDEVVRVCLELISYTGDQGSSDRAAEVQSGRCLVSEGALGGTEQRGAGLEDQALHGAVKGHSYEQIGYGSKQDADSGSSSCGGGGSGAGLHFVHVLRLELVDWPSFGTAHMRQLSAAFPKVVDLTLGCRCAHGTAHSHIRELHACQYRGTQHCTLQGMTWWPASRAREHVGMLG